MSTPPPLRPGEVYLLGRAASVQFHHPILVRVIRVDDKPTYHGWAWVDCYETDRSGNAIDRRTLFLQPAGAVHLDITTRRVPAQRPVAVAA